MFSLLKMNNLRRLRLCKTVGLSNINGSVKTYSYEKLHHRSLLRVCGKEASSLLQGLVTNDMRHIDEGARSMYTLFLNVKGRVMYDTIIYKGMEENTYLIECDSTALPDLKKHLQMYRVRRKVDIDSVESSYNIWVVYHNQEAFKPSTNQGTVRDNDTEYLVTTLISKLSDVQSNGIVCRDPRLFALGLRLIAPIDANIATVMKPFAEVKDSISYKTLRYCLGVGEGVEELPPGKCFPMETNCDYLHGVSFHKGCYVGQELTARVHHTGVVRKRLMPVFLHSVPSEPFIIDAPIEIDSEVKASIGKLRGLEKTYGLGLLRVNEALSVPSLKLLKTTGHTVKPHWWPKEAPKERLSSKDSSHEAL